MAELVVCGAVPLKALNKYYLMDLSWQNGPSMAQDTPSVNRYFCLPVISPVPAVPSAPINIALLDQIYSELSLYNELPLSMEKMASLVQAVIEVESHFVSETKSHRGAIGLMQLMPITALDMMLKMNTDELSHLGIETKDPLFTQLAKIRDTDNKLRRCQKGEGELFKALLITLRNEKKRAKKMIARKLYDDNMNLSLGIRNLVYLLDKYRMDGENERTAVNILYLALASYATGTYYVDKHLREGEPEEQFAYYGDGYANKVIAAYESRIGMLAVK